MKGNKYQIDQHTKYSERLDAAKDLKSNGKEGWRIFVDAMDNRTQEAWGQLPNMGFLIDPQGRIAQKWSWITSASGKTKKNGDEKTTDAYTLLDKAADLAPYSIGDDPQLPLYDTREGEWLKYKLADGEETVVFAPAGDGKVKRTAGKKDVVIELKTPELPKKRAELKSETLEVGKFKLPCVVLKADGIETWYSTWLPGDGVAKVIKDGEVVRVLSDAGYKPGESCLIAFDPEPKK